MKKFALSLILSCTILYSYSQQSTCDNDRYFNTVFDDVTVTTDVQYGQNTTVGDNTINLLMDIYEPEGDVEESRPLIVFAHGGGFVGGDKSGVAYICEDYAQRGFVVASISYRLMDIVTNDQLLWAESILMSFHDMKAAIRYFREDAATDNNYRIDPDFIFTGGVSAGAIMASNVAYMDSLDNIPAYLIPIIADNGGFEGNSSDNTQYSSAVQGVLNYAGGVIDPEFIDADEAPLYSFHDEFDDLVSCTFDISVSPFYGSCLMHEMADDLGIFNKFYFRSESYNHVAWSYGTVLYESAQFLGEILCESTADSPWTEIGSGLDKPGFVCFDISAIDENILWTVPFNGNEFSRTTDGGQTWTTGIIPFSNPNFGTTTIHAFDENTAILMGLSFPDQAAGKMYKTTDGGATWVEQTSSFVNPNEGPQVFHFFNENDGFALAQVKNGSSGSNTHIGYVTSDGGDNWTALSEDDYPAQSGENLSLSDVNFMDAKGDHIWFGVSTGKIFHSADKGNHWEVVGQILLSNISSLAFKDELNGIALATNFNDEPVAYTTDDGGQTWNAIDIPSTPRPRGVYFVPGSADNSTCGTYLIHYGWNTTTGMAYSTDDGQSWTLASEQPVFATEFLSPEIGWMGGLIHGADNGGLYKWNGPSLAGSNSCITSTQQINTTDSYLSIFPNPTTETTQVQLYNNWRGTIHLSIVNSLGQVILQQSIPKPQNQMSCDINTKHFTPGAYQVLLTDGQRSASKPMIKF